MTTEDVLWNELTKTPEKWSLYLVLADLYEDQGEISKANCLRWTSQKKRRPRWEYRNTWYDEEHYKLDKVDPQSNLPQQIFAAVNTGEYSTAISYQTLREAFEALFAVWTEVSEV